LRQLLNFIAGFPEVEKIHLIAHSRGTDVALAAVRELTIAARAAGINPREKYKIRNLVLAAPDLDVEVATQRITGDYLGYSVDRFTVYTSPADKAIGISSRLFASPRGRVGTYGPDELTDTMKARMEFAMKSSPSNFAIVNFAGATDAEGSEGDRYGHSYFRDAPTVSSDLVLLLRDDLDPGGPGRPLEHLGLRFWRIPPGYPFAGPTR
jgi:esterase/lipase superfamily enzyme